MHQCTFKTSIIQKNNIQITEHAFYTDAEFVVKTLCYVNTVEILPMTVYCYRTMRAGQSMSDQGIRKHYKEHERVIFKTLHFLDTTPKTKSYDYACERVKEMIKTHYYFCFCLEPSNDHEKELVIFDKKIQKKYPQYYTTTDKKIMLLRKTHFFSYKPLCLIRMIKNSVKK